jgi:hypothetical protein
MFYIGSTIIHKKVLYQIIESSYWTQIQNH